MVFCGGIFFRDLDKRVSLGNRCRWLDRPGDSVSIWVIRIGIRELRRQSTDREGISAHGDFWPRNVSILINAAPAPQNIFCEDVIRGNGIFILIRDGVFQNRI